MRNTYIKRYKQKLVSNITRDKLGSYELRKSMF